MTIFYCFPSEQDYIDAITTTKEVENADGGLDLVTEQNPPANVDVIGVISKRTGGTDEEPIFTEMDGYCVNTPSPVEGWEAHQVFPASPQRVYWRGFK